jgi:hypothetical protein
MEGAEIGTLDAFFVGLPVFHMKICNTSHAERIDGSFCKGIRLLFEQGIQP